MVHGPGARFVYVRTRGIGNQRCQPLFPQGSVAIFLAHVQDGGPGERDMVSIFILSILIQMNTSIHVIVLGS